MEKIKRILPILVVLLLSIPTILPLFHTGIFTMHDNTQVARVYQMAIALQDGMFPVRWVPDLGYGYGYPIFNFYAPLPYYIGAFVYLLSGTAVLSTKIMIGIGIMLAGVSMFVCTRRFFGNFASVAAAITYMYFPYHALNIYVRGAIGEVYAYAFLPLVFYGLFRIFEEGKSLKKALPGILITSVALTLTIISHNLTAFMLTVILLPIIALGIILASNKKMFILFTLLSFILAALLSAFYAVPALLEMGYTNVLSQVGGGADFVDHFVCPMQLWSSNWGFGGSAPGCIDGISFALGKNNIFFAAFSLAVVVYLWKRTKPRHLFPTVAAFVVLLLSLFLILPLSRPLWEIFPSIEFLQFPWRFLNFTSLSLSLLVASGIWAIDMLKFKKAALAAAVLVVVSQVFLHYDIFQAQDFDTTPEEEHIKKDNLNFEISKISDEYLPQGFAKPQTAAQVPTEKIDVLEGDADIVYLTQNTKQLDAIVTATRPARLRINSAPFPAWSLYIGGEKMNFESSSDGIYFTLPPGKHNISYVYQSTQVQKTANAATLIGVVALSLGIIALRKK